MRGIVVILAYSSLVHIVSGQSEGTANFVSVAPRPGLARPERFQGPSSLPVNSSNATSPASAPRPAISSRVPVNVSHVIYIPGGVGTFGTTAAGSPPSPPVLSPPPSPPSPPPTPSGEFRQLPPPGSGTASSPPPPSIVVPTTADESKGKSLSDPVIVVISLSAAIFISAVIASAIRLARRRQQRRALVVKRDGGVSKPGSGNQRPVIEVGQSQLPSSESSVETGSESVVGPHQSAGSNAILNIVPSFQRHKRKLYFPNLLVRKLVEPGVIVQNPVIPAMRGNYDGHLEMRLGPVPMEVDEVNASAEDGFSADETEEMDYTTSNGAPQPCKTPSQDTEAQARHPGSSSLGVSTADEAYREGDVDLEMGCITSEVRRGSLDGSASYRGSTSESRAEHVIDPSDIELCLRDDGTNWKLGEGGFGTVYKALRGGVTEVAVKVLTQRPNMNLDAFQREAWMLAACKDPHICQFLGCCFTPSCSMIVTEFCPDGCLRTKLGWGGEYQWKGKGRKLMRDVAAGLAYLHASRIIHFDLTSSNVLIVHGTRAKITDVGLSSALSSANYVSQISHCGTFAYAAPELLLGQKCSSAADMFSFGVLLHEVITGRPPQRGRLRDLTIPDDVESKEIVDLFNACIDLQPKARPTAIAACRIIDRFQ